MIKWNYSQDAKIVQCQSMWYISLTKGKIKIIWHLNKHRKNIWQNSTSFHDKKTTIKLVFVFVVQLLSHVWLFATPWTAAWQASLSFTVSWSLLKLMLIESMISSNHLILCRSLLLLLSIFPNITVYSNESALRIRWPKYWSFSFSISPSNE